MSLRMVCANFRNPSLHRLEQPLMVAEGRQAGLAGWAAGAQKGRLPPRLPLELGACLGERTPRAGRTPDAPGAARLPLQRVRLLRPRSLRGTMLAPFPVLPSTPSCCPRESCPQEELRLPGRAQGALRTERESGAGREAGAGGLPGLGCLSFLHGSGNGAINAQPEGRGGDRCTETRISSLGGRPQRPGWRSRSLSLSLSPSR